MAPIWMMVRNRDDDDEDDQGDENDLAGMGKEWCYMNHDIKEQLQGPLPSTAIYIYPAAHVLLPGGGSHDESE